MKGILLSFAIGLALSLFSAVPASCLDSVEAPEFGRFFQEAGVEGTLVLAQENGKALVYAPERAATGYLPASTFKILNSCIALETGVTSASEVFPWSGVKHPIEAWNKDLTLCEAFAASSVPIFQEIARRIGPERMERWVRESHYGNADIGGGIDTFWLNGKLRVSALEQIDFLRRLYRGELPFSAKTQAEVRELMRTESGQGWLIRAKTGFTARVKPGVGWWVGWLERGDEVWFFALNIAITDNAQLTARQEIVKAVLKARGFIR
jgi:beta-lactamase class D